MSDAEPISSAGSVPLVSHAANTGELPAGIGSERIVIPVDPVPASTDPVPEHLAASGESPVQKTLAPKPRRFLVLKNLGNWRGGVGEIFTDAEWVGLYGPIARLEQLAKENPPAVRELIDA